MGSEVDIMVIPILLLLLLSCTVPASKRRSHRAKATLVPRVLYLERCEDKKHFMYLHNVSSLVDGKGLLYLNVDVDVRKAARSFTLMKITIHKCREVVSSNTCEYFATWPLTTGCNVVTAKGMMWSGFIHAFDPPFKCPFQPGFYKVHNATLDVNLGETLGHLTPRTMCGR